jgi:hypothetical protein
MIILTPTMDDHAMDEALWTAYRCHDKSAVTMNLLRRYLQEPNSFPSLSATQWRRSRARAYIRLAVKSPCEIHVR